MPASFTNLLFHVVFTTRERRALITPSLRDRLYPYLGGVTRRKRGVLLEIGGVSDHVHLLIKLPPDVAVATVVGALKANSSKRINALSELGPWYGWQDAYAAFSVSESQVAHRGLTAPATFCRPLRG
jgi:REP element-mobilizing transposase RayT